MYPYACDVPEKGQKRKLTLSVNKDVVQRAKELGLNLPEITESVL
jgi:post-segregation antitoxin (ccd killing protein)